MRLYHFLNEHYGLKALCDQRLKVSEIMELNDPFELLSVDIADKDMREAFNALKRDFSTKYGLLCFSKKWVKPAQWTHYADNHKGLCLGFDFSDNGLMKVSYVKERLDSPTTNEELNREFMKKVISTKHLHWKYEKEYRVFVPKKIEINGLYFSSFSKEFELKEIIVGAKSDITRSGIHKILGDNNSDIEPFKVRPAF
ncbi:DUF2971 domain-containing protein [Candidatus Spongiihabitans sp.]|uniref:DUF2971 domain-containing protein n=1 Tax=Candidatus Spongiihabitans sp. TaxID=3101308 RepID=UPI003C7B3C78